MTGRSRWIGAGCVLWCAAAVAKADIVVTLAAFADGEAVEGPVEPGTVVTLDVLLSVTPDEDPLPEVRSLQFDTQAAADGLEITDYEWTLDEQGLGPNYFLDSEPPIVGADHIVGSILELTVEPVRVGRFTVVANGPGLFSLTGGDGADPNNVDEGLRFRVGFADPVDYSVFEGSVDGGTINVEVGDGQPGGNENGNGNGNDNAADNDNDGGAGNENDNAPPRDRNVGPLAQVQFCGFGMLGAWVCMLAGLAAWRWQRRVC